MNMRMISMGMGVNDEGKYKNVNYTTYSYDKKVQGVSQKVVIDLDGIFPIKTKKDASALLERLVKGYEGIRVNKESAELQIESNSDIFEKDKNGNINSLVVSVGKHKGELDYSVTHVTSDNPLFNIAFSEPTPKTAIDAIYKYRYHFNARFID